jgi:hypothetical protein
MDLKMNAEDINTSGISWDCKLESGIVPIIQDEEEDVQTGTLAAFLIRGTIPLLPEAGVPWTDYLSGGMTFGEIDFYIRKSLQNVGKENFYPQYSIDKDKLTMNISKA